MEPSDPWGETLEAQILLKKRKDQEVSTDLPAVQSSKNHGDLSNTNCVWGNLTWRRWVDARRWRQSHVHDSGRGAGVQIEVVSRSVFIQCWWRRKS